MKNKLLQLRLSHFFRQRIPGKDASSHIPELGKTESEWKKTESVIRDILRWADDGGKMLDSGNMMAGSNSELSGAVR